MRMLTIGLVLLTFAMVFAVTRFGGDEEDVGLVTVADGGPGLQDDSTRDTARRSVRPRPAALKEEFDDPDEIEAETETLPPGEGVVLQVVDPSGLPEAGAVVRLFKEPDRQRSMRRGLLSVFGGAGESERNLLAEYTSDDEGRVELDRRLGPRTVAEARKGDLFGQYKGGTEGELPVPDGVEGLIVMEPVKFLDVRLIGPGGGMSPTSSSPSVPTSRAGRARSTSAAVGAEEAGARAVGATCSSAEVFFFANDLVPESPSRASRSTRRAHSMTKRASPSQPSSMDWRRRERSSP